MHLRQFSVDVRLAADQHKCNVPAGHLNYIRTAEGQIYGSIIRKLACEQ